MHLFYRVTNIVFYYLLFAFKLEFFLSDVQIYVLGRVLFFNCKYKFDCARIRVIVRLHLRTFLHLDDQRLGRSGWSCLPSSIPSGWWFSYLSRLTCHDSSRSCWCGRFRRCLSAGKVKFLELFAITRLGSCLSLVLSWDNVSNINILGRLCSLSLLLSIFELCPLRAVILLLELFGDDELLHSLAISNRVLILFLPD